MEKMILDLENQAMERWRNGDPMGFVEQAAEEIIYTDPFLMAPLIGLENFNAYMQNAIGQVYYHKSEFISPKVVRVGDAALLTYNYRSSQLDEQGKLLSQIPWNCTEVRALRGGAWMIVHNHWSFLMHRVRDLAQVPIPIRSGAEEYEGVLGELMKLERAAMLRWRQGDPNGFLQLYAEEMTYFDTGTEQRINGRKAMQERYQQIQGKIFYEVMDFIDPQLILLGDMAVLFYRFLSTRLETDGAVKHRTPWNCTEIYHRMDGDWRIIHNHWSHISGERY